MRRPAPYAFLVLAATLMSGTVHAQCEVQKIVASDPGAADQFGRGVDLSGDVAIVGADRDDDTASNSGSAHIYRRAGGLWTHEQKLVSPAPGSSYHFGQSVAISGNVAVVGVPDDDDVASRAGSVDVYRFNGAAWVHEQELTASDAASSDRFGWSVDTDGDMIAVGAKTDDDVESNSGSAYVFRFNGSTWIQVQKLVAADPAANAQFGDAISTDGTSIVVGAWQDDDAGFFSGSAYVFRFDGAAYVADGKLTALAAGDFEWFGRSVAVDGDVIAVGAYAGDNGGMDTGAGFIFRRAAGVWTQEAKLIDDHPASGDDMGWSIGVQGDLAAVGVRGKGSSASGSILIFEKSGGSWSAGSIITATDQAAGDQVGSALAMSSGDILSAGWLHDSAGTNAGAAWFFSTGPECFPGSTSCFGLACPCGNDDHTAGCANSTGSGARLGGSGSTSVALDNLVLSTTGAPPNNSGLYFMGGATFAPIAVSDGQGCTGGLFRFFPGTVSGTGVFALTTPIAGAPAGQITAGDTRHFQSWTRDVLCGPPPMPCPSPCGMNSNLSNVYSVTFRP